MKRMLIDAGTCRILMFVFMFILNTLKFGYSLNFSGLINENSMVFDNCKEINSS